MAKSKTRTLARLWELVRPYKWSVLILFLVLFFTQAVIVSEKYIFKLVVDRGTDFSKGTLSADAFMRIFVMLVVVFAVVQITKVTLRWLRMHFMNTLEARVIADLKRKFYNHIIRLSHRFHTTNKTGSLIARLTRGSRAIESMMDSFIFNFLPISLQLVIIAFALFTLSPGSLAIILGTVVLFIAGSFYIQRKQFRAQLAANNADDAEKAYIGDTLTNVEAIKYYGKEGAIIDSYRQKSENTKRTQLKAWNYYREMDVWQTGTIGLGMLAIIAYPVHEVLAGAMSIGTLVFIYTLFLGLIEPMYSFISGIRTYYRSTADFDSLYVYMYQHNEIAEPAGAPALTVRKGSVEFRNVSFSYQKRKIINSFSLKIRPNEKVAFVGHSGAGKSTLIKLLYRFYDVNEGAILIDGVDIRGVRQESLRSELSIVPQETVLFDDTIYNNILFSRPSATRQEVLAAMRFAQLDRIIATFPDKEDTIVGERGIKLSGGEKQRVSIARALLANKNILVLDEATSSLDSQTEHDIQLALGKLMKGRTAIIIAHRLSTIMKADRIIVMDKGRIVQEGTHRELIRKQGTYRKLWELQRGGYIE